MKKLMLAALLCSAAIPAQSQTIMVFGQGLEYCSKIYEINEALLTAWVGGYVTASNWFVASATSTATDLTGGLDTEFIIAALKRTCRQYPGEKIHWAMSQTIQQFPAGPAPRPQATAPVPPPPPPAPLPPVRKLEFPPPVKPKAVRTATYTTKNIDLHLRETPAPDGIDILTIPPNAVITVATEQCQVFMRGAGRPNVWCRAAFGDRVGWLNTYFVTGEKYPRLACEINANAEGC